MPAHQSPAYRFLRGFTTRLHRAVFPLSVEGLEHLEALGDAPFILAGNHTGFLDGPALVTASPRAIRFLSDEAVCAWPVVGPGLLAVGAIPVNPRQPRPGLKRAVQALAEGDVLCIFPEGKLTRDGEIDEFEPGVLLLQRQSGAPIVPFALVGGFEAWPWGRWLPRPGKIRLAFGPPLQLNEEADKTAALSRLKATIQGLKTALASPDRG